MAFNFKNLPNEKVITITNLSELKADSTAMLQLQAKDNQAGLIINETTGQAYTFNKAFNATGTFKLVPTDGIYHYRFDFSTLGSAVGVIELDGPKLPANVDIIDGYFDVTTPFTSDGAAQFSLGTNSSTTTNLKTAAVLGTNGTSGRKVIVPDWGANGVTNIIDISTATQPVIEITVADLTDGVLELFLVCRQRVA